MHNEPTPSLYAKKNCTIIATIHEILVNTTNIEST